MVDSPWADLRVIHVNHAKSYFSNASSDAFMMRACSVCGGTQMGVIADTIGAETYWLRCLNCGRAHVLVDDVLSPGASPLATPLGLVGEAAAAWREICDCLSVGAYTAAVMLCRKLLLHVAVGNGLAMAGTKSPTFAEAVDHLEAQGVITAKMKPWIDRIREVGNEANHELPAISEAEALDVGRFTEQLLRLAYEMDHLMRGAGNPVVGPGA